MTVKPWTRYIGAKWKLAASITPYLQPTRRYVEPYCGTGAMYLNLPWRPKHTILNDLNDEIINVFEMVRTRHEDLIRAITLTSCACHTRSCSLSCHGVSDPIERARMFLIRQWMSYSTNQKGQGFRHNGIKGRSSTYVLWRDVPNRIMAILEPLRDAEIFNRPALEIVSYYNTADTTLFVDPPYVLSTRKRKYYTHEMSDQEHIELINALSEHRGPVVLCGYHSDLYAEHATLARGWRVIELAANAEKGGERLEVLWLRNIETTMQTMMEM